MNNITGEKAEDNSIFEIKNYTLYKDTKENIVEVRDFVKDTKNQTFENVSFGMTLVFIAAFGTMIVYGYNVFSSVQSVAQRIGSNGMNIRVGI